MMSKTIPAEMSKMTASAMLKPVRLNLPIKNRVMMIKLTSVSMMANIQSAFFLSMISSVLI